MGALHSKTGKIFLCETTLWKPNTVSHLEGERWGTATTDSPWKDKLLCSKTDHPPAVHCTFCLNCCRLRRMSSPWGLISLCLPHDIEGLANTFPINYCYCKEGNRQGKGLCSDPSNILPAESTCRGRISKCFQEPRRQMQVRNLWRRWIAGRISKRPTTALLQKKQLQNEVMTLQYSPICWHKFSVFHLTIYQCSIRRS